MNDGLELQKRKISFFLKIFHTKNNSTPDYKTKIFPAPKSYFLNVTKSYLLRLQNIGNISCNRNILNSWFKFHMISHFHILTASKYFLNIKKIKNSFVSTDRFKRLSNLNFFFN